MTSIKRYLRAYISVMPRRIKFFQAAFSAKKKIDARILKGKATRKDVYELLMIIGEDTLFAHAEKKNKQTIRHYVWKLSKSMNYLYSGRNRFLALASRATTKEADKLVKFVNIFAEEASKRARVLERLDKLLIKEVAELESIKKRKILDWQHYTRLIDSENKEIQELVAYGEEIKPHLRSFGGYVKAITNGMLKGSLQDTSGFIAIIAGLYALALIYWPEPTMGYLWPGAHYTGQPLVEMDIMGSPITHILGGGALLTVIARMSGSAFKFVKEFVRESI